MRCLKAFGLAAVAVMALTAFLGVGAASATVVCTTNVHETCGLAWTHIAGVAVDATRVVPSSGILENTSGSILATCTEGTIKGKTVSEGGAGKPVTGNIESISWGGCSQTTDTVANGSFSIEASSGTNGTLSGSGSQVTVSVFGASCTYGTGIGTTLGTIAGGNPATLEINAVLAKQGGGFLCPETVKWTDRYTIREPKPLYISTN